jgi:flagellar basal body-associated protein FliL
MSKVYKLREDEVEAVKEKLMKFVIDKKTLMKETDVIHALIKYHLNNLKAEEVLRYREEVLKKDD